VDGRWAYTLYDGGGATPFVHALDTSDASARCIDLDRLDRATLGRLRLRLTDGGRTVDVVDGSRRVAALDTGTLTVRGPSGRSSWPVAAGAAALAAFLAAAAVWLWRRAASRVADRRASVGLSA